MILFVQLLTWSILSIHQQPTIDSTADQGKVETAVLHWADSTFAGYDNYKFERFKAFYTDAFFIQQARKELYTEKLTGLEEAKANGTYRGTEEDYESEVQKIKTAMDRPPTKDGEPQPRVTHYQIYFWANIKTTDGITVYYELALQLNDDYRVTLAEENSSIGKKETVSEIAYLPGEHAIRVTEKKNIKN